VILVSRICAAWVACFRPRLETLETREVPALYVTFENLIPAYHDGRVGGNLNITGTNGSDRIVVRQINGRITIDGVKEIPWIDYTGTYGYFGEYKTPHLFASMVHFISIHGGDGEDRILLNSQDVPGQQPLRPLFGTYIEGGSGNDYIVGTEVKDKIYGGPGADIIYGRGGNDLLYGNEGDDKLYGGEGDDILYGGIGNDLLYGNVGDDKLYGGEGDDILYGGIGNDRLYGNEGDDKLYGNEGDDFLFGGDGNDLLSGNQGKDNLFGQGGIDTLYGIAGEDHLNGGTEDDILYVTVSFPLLMANKIQTLPYNSYVNGSADSDTLDITIGTHGFSTALLGPYLGRIRQTLASFAPLVNRLNASIPLISQFNPKLTLGGFIAKAAGVETSYRRFLNLYNNAWNLAKVPAYTGANLHLGRFTVRSPNALTTQIAPNLSRILLSSSLLQAARNAGMNITFLDRPITLIQALMGMSNIDLVTYNLPSLNIRYDDVIARRTFLVGPAPITATLSGLLQLQLAGEFRLQSQALTEGLASGLTINAWADLTAGIGIKAIAGGAFRVAGVRIAGAEAGAVGGINGTISYSYDAVARTMNRYSTLSYGASLFADFRVLNVGYNYELVLVRGTL